MLLEVGLQTPHIDWYPAFLGIIAYILSPGSALNPQPRLLRETLLRMCLSPHGHQGVVHFNQMSRELRDGLAFIMRFLPRAVPAGNFALVNGFTGQEFDLNTVLFDDDG
jgi:hypothetical protein